MDIGCGSGLFSLAACRLGAAQVISFDRDSRSIETASNVRARYGIDPGMWTITHGSVLDETFLASLPAADVVYAWGVLHHTGSMWRAIDNACGKVALGGRLAISIYNKVERRVGGSGLWLRIKRFYVNAPRPVQWVMEQGYGANVFMRHAVTLRNPIRLVREYENEKSRGMDFWCDLKDWIGGYPYEYATAGEVFNYVHRQHGFVLQNLTTTHSLGCNQFVFSRRTDPPPMAST
jgi:2-polyprenyl-6-hydroxyphenyl methylase/3-demethylubiquinone-9 3-methyltransferase